MQKQVVVPLALLFLPSATAVLFLLFYYSFFYLLYGGAVFSPSQPAWVHFCLTHQRLLARLCLVGMGCSLLNAALTAFYFIRRESAAAIGPNKMSIMTPLFVTVVISLPLSTAGIWAGNHTSLFSPPALSQGGSISYLIEDYLFPKALLFVLIGIILVLWASATLLILLSALRCAKELWNRVRCPVPPRIPVVLEAESPYVP